MLTEHLARLQPITKVAFGVFGVLIVLLVVFYNSWILLTTLPRYTYLILATVVAFTVASLLLVIDLSSQAL